MSRIELSDLGRFATRYGVMTVASEWIRTIRLVEHMADADEDWEFFLQEKIAGLEEILVERRKRGEYWLAPLSSTNPEPEKP